jgi:spectrin beta
LADDKREALNLSHKVNQWHMESQETMTWIREKAKLIESTDELGNDLAG